MTNQEQKFHQRINGKGWREQERALLFPSLYANGKVLNRNFRGYGLEFEIAYKRGKFKVY